MIMRFVQRLRFVFRALSVEDERNLAFILGNHVGQVAALRGKRPYGGVFFRVCIFFFFLARNISLNIRPIPQARFFFYSDTHNQRTALRTTIKALPRDSSLAAYSPGLKAEQAEFREMSVAFSLSDVLIALMTFVIRAPRLYIKLKVTHPAATKNFFNFFCMSYIYIPYFFRVLKAVNCGYVIQSNDHNVVNRSLRLVAEMLGLKNVYMQHASVSALFPPLQFDHAFLDGLASFNVYHGCSRTLDDGVTTLKTGSIYLSGQKKEVHEFSGGHERKYLALAVNALDTADRVIDFLKVIEPLNIDVCIRMHPAQSDIFARKIETFSSGKRWLSTHRSKDRSLVDFFRAAYFLVAADSSIHLEAAIFGLCTYYCEFSSVEIPDYYGYLNSGLVSLFPFDSLSNGEVSIFSLADANPNIQAIQFYSSTFGTVWQGREGELVANCLLQIDAGETIDNLFSLCLEFEGKVYRPR
ncbi:MAG: hypothetical protein ACN6P2_22930 [Pseudomonas palmensis]|uniref:hypothetical protein n=1 Tax=Pseudomonas palmensis TaxID=2815362 RepID=UPI003D0F4BC0